MFNKVCVTVIIIYFFWRWYFVNKVWIYIIYMYIHCIYRNFGLTYAKKLVQLPFCQLHFFM
ncbi:hypothetical protein AO721_01520 [Aeromonas veronii]|nr:hypothetical protein AO728_01335 [Aeromonas veronii]KRV79046.1 hypothetical protein AO719_01335 [Aeromonas veronii]KRV90650.1 hypothetical protein AO721_01520 [Aeromonas veronii]KRV91928.1 hypothetical protein AO739_00725 [Aeromonas veronii]